jgi:hypothetical protein
MQNSNAICALWKDGKGVLPYLICHRHEKIPLWG